jgi:uncharacterized membrane protein
MNRSLLDWLGVYGGRCLGALLGLLLALAVLQYGLLRTIFILLVVTAGYVVGLRVDESGGLLEFYQRLTRRD